MEWTLNSIISNNTLCSCSVTLFGIVRTLLSLWFFFNCLSIKRISFHESKIELLSVSIRTPPTHYQIAQRGKWNLDSLSADLLVLVSYAWPEGLRKGWRWRREPHSRPSLQRGRREKICRVVRAVRSQPGWPNRRPRAPWGDRKNGPSKHVRNGSGMRVCDFTLTLA